MEYNIVQDRNNNDIISIKAAPASFACSIARFKRITQHILPFSLSLSLFLSLRLTYHFYQQYTLYSLSLLFSLLPEWFWRNDWYLKTIIATSRYKYTSAWPMPEENRACASRNAVFIGDFKGRIAFHDRRSRPRDRLPSCKRAQHVAARLVNPLAA